MIPGEAGAAVSFVLGLIFGSFANVCIHRLPEGRSVVTPRSRCPACGSLIAWYDNVPVLSWVFLRARCRRCGGRIGWIYPLVELAMGGGFLACYLMFGPGLEGAAAAWLFFSCVVLWAIDGRHFLLPDAVTVPGIVAGVLFAAGRGLARLPGAGESSASDLFIGRVLDHPPLILSSLAGAAAGAAIPLVARAGYMLSRKLRAGAGGTPAQAEDGGQGPAPDDEASGEGGGAERDFAGEAAGGADGEAGEIAEAALEEGMGLGDVKMLAMVGAFLGPRSVLVTILAGSVTGCVVVIPWLLATRRGMKTPIPFGPFLAFGAIVALFAGEALASGYSRLLLRLMG